MPKNMERNLTYYTCGLGQHKRIGELDSKAYRDACLQRGRRLIAGA
jgi:hypothetical protein